MNTAKSQNLLPFEPAETGLEGAIESILLVAGGPVTLRALATALGEPTVRVKKGLEVVKARLVGGIRLQMDDGRVQLVTAPEQADFVRRFLGTAKPAPLSRASLEVLAVIAYQQPVTRPEIEAARGVNSDRAVQTLLARDLIEEKGQRETPGRPMEYRTAFGFLEYFGLSSLDDLPPLEAPGDEELVEAVSLGLRQEAP